MNRASQFLIDPDTPGRSRAGQMFRLVRGTGHVLDVLHRGRLALRIHDGARQIYGYRDAELATLAQASVEASFAPPELKTQISIDIKQWLYS